MSILLVLCVLGAAGWLLLSVLARDSADDPGDSVAAHSRAMQALNPTGRTPSRGTVSRQPRRRTARPTSRRPAAHRRARRAAAGHRNRVSAR